MAGRNRDGRRDRRCFVVGRIKGDVRILTLFANGLSAPLARFRTIAAKLRERGGHHAIRAACRIERAIEEESPARR